MNDKKNMEELQKLLQEGDAWLRKFGIVDPSMNKVFHNNIVINLYVNFPKVRYVEYFMSDKAEDRWIKIVLYLPTFTLMFTNKDKLIDEVVDLIREYLYDYDVTVELKRFRKETVKS